MGAPVFVWAGGDAAALAAEAEPVRRSLSDKLTLDPPS